MGMKEGNINVSVGSVGVAAGGVAVTKEADVSDGI